MKFLLIEDDEDKSKKISEFINENFRPQTLITARSMNTGLRLLIKHANELDIVLLDMSMPNFDVSPDEPTGGTPENFAGEEILAQMQLRAIFAPTIVISMFDSFGEKSSVISLEQLASKLEIKYSPNFRGYVYYSASQEGWQQSLKKVIEKNLRCAK